MKFLLAQNLLYLPSHGGANRANRLLLEQLVAAGHEGLAVAPALGASGFGSFAEFSQELARRGLRATRQGPAEVFSWNGVDVHLVREPGMLPAEIARRIESSRPDVVLVTSEDPEQVVLAAALSTASAPVLCFAHTTQALPHGELGRRGLETLRRADGVAAVSRHVSEVLASAGIASRILNFPVYGSPPVREPDFVSGKVTLINAGAAKGLPILLGLADAFPEVCFLAVTGWSTEAEDRHELSRRPNIEVMGSRDDIESIYQRTRLLLVPSLVAEAFGYVAVEAQLRGIPVLAAAVGGLPEAALGTAELLPVNCFSPELQRGIDQPAPPPQELGPWMAALARLTADETTWRQASVAARRAAGAFVAGIGIEPFVSFATELVKSGPRRSTVSEKPTAPEKPTDAPSQAARALLALRALRQRRETTAGIPLALPRRAEGNRFPLSSAQRRLWMLWRLEPESSAYNEAAAVHLAGALRCEALGRALAHLVNRHEALRTHFEEGENEPQQVISEPATPDLGWIDLAALPPREVALRLEGLAALEARRLFDLSRGGLLRLRLLRLGPAQHALIAVAHHIVCDGWSLGIFVRELSELYSASVEGRPPMLPPLPLQYADFAVWQRQQLNTGELAAGLATLKKRLDPPPPPLELPAPPRDLAGAGPGSRERRVSATLVGALKRLAEEEKASLFVLLAAAYAAVLARVTGQLGFALGTPIAGRRRPELAPLIGYFLNVLVLPLRLDPAGSARRLIAETRRVAFEAFDHQDVPFEELLEALSPERDLQRTPLFQAFFNMLNLDLPPGLRFPDIELSPLPLPASAAKFDLSLYALEVEGGLLLRASFDQSRLLSAQVEQLLTHLHEWLEQVVQAPDRRLTSFVFSGVEITRHHQPRPAPAPGEAAQLAVETSIPERFLAWVKQHPESLAVLGTGETWSYAELAAAAGSVAAVLEGLQEKRVALLFEPGAAMVAAILGILAAGAAYVPLDTAHPDERLASILADAEPGAMLGSRALLSRARTLAGASFPVWCFEELSPAPLAVAGGVRAASLAYLLYTSGSTGEPKGVAQSHGGVLRQMKAYATSLALHPEDRLLMVASYAFDAAVMDLFGALCHGAAVVVVDLKRIGFGGLVEAVVGGGVTVYHSTPTVFRFFAASADVAVGGSALRLVVLGGEPVLASDLELFRARLPPRCLLVNGLGPTESTLGLQFFADRSTLLSTPTLPVGYPVLNTEVTLETAAGEQVALFGRGEIVISSPQLALGYWRRETETRHAFSPHPAGDGRRSYRTGDFGRRLEGGAIEFLGRGDSQVKIRGQRLELAEVEGRLRALPELAEAAVAAMPTAPGAAELRLVAWYVPRPGSTVSAASLAARLRAFLPDAMVPTAFVELPRLPLTTTGKIDRRRLPPPAEAASAGPTRRPADELEAALAAIWSEVLGRDNLPPEANFFELGGHSLAAIRVLSRLRQALAVELPLRSLFEAPQLADFTAVVRATLSGSPEGNSSRPIARAGRSGEPRFPLALAQQRLWVLEQLEPGDPAYFVARVLRLSGRFAPETLRAAVSTLVARHESLRTAIVAENGLAFQQVAPALSVHLPVIELSALVSSLRGVVAERLARLETRRPFVLGRAPLWRLSLLRQTADEHWLLLTQHHILTDAWSTEVLVRDLSVLYAAALAGQPATLPELPVQYGDVVLWQREALGQRQIEAGLEYWRRQLAGQRRSALPRDRPPRSANASRARRALMRLPAAWPQQLRATAAGLAATPFMVALAALKALLLRFGAGGDLSVGTPITGRKRLETENLIGFFVNTLVLRTRLAVEQSFRRAVERVRLVTLEAHAHDEVPFEQLVEALAAERDLETSPFFQLLFVFQGEPTPTPNLPGLELEVLDIDPGGAQFELALRLLATPDGAVASLEGPEQLFDRTTLERFLSAWSRLLQGALEDPDLPLAALPLLPPAALHQLTVEWNDTTAPATGGATIRGAESLDAVIEQTAATAPERIAVEAEEGLLSYAELERRATLVAARLAGCGVGVESIVGVELERSLALSVALLGTLKAGAAYLPLDASYPADRRTFMLEDAGATVLIAAAGRQEPPGLMVIALDAEGQPLEASFSGPAPRPMRCPLHPAYLIYTSGSTGKPKGVVNTHAGILNRLDWMQAYFRLDGDGRVLQKTPISFDVSVWELFWPLLVGARLVLARPDAHRDPFELAALCETRAISITHFVPSMLAAFLDALADAPPALGRRWPRFADLVASGEALPFELARRAAGWSGAAVTNLYGPTEAAVDVTVARFEPRDRDGSMPIGRPIANTATRVVDRSFTPAPLGVAGELLLGGVNLARGYHRRPALTAERFIPAGEPPGTRFYRTGDLVRQRADGAIEFLGRLDFQLKVRGQRVELGEIEAQLLSHPGVSAAVVVASLDESEKARLVAYWCPTTEPTSQEALRDHLASRLPEAMVPALWMKLQVLPLSPNGKVDRRALPTPEPPRQPEESSGHVPQNDTEEALARLWAEVLGLERVGRHDNFFRLGGDSILAIQLVARARRAGLVVTPRQLFRYPSVAGLAGQLASSKVQVSSHPHEPDGPIALTPIQHWFFGLELARPEHFNQAVMLEADTGAVEARAWAQAWAAVLSAHPALATAFRRGADGWRQQRVGVTTTPPPMLDLARLEPQTAEQVCEALAARSQGRLDLASGRLTAALAFHLGARRRLHLVIHHLVVDGLSWRILLADFAAALAAARQGRVVDLGPPSTSFGLWSESLRRYAASAELTPARRYWLAEAELPLLRAWLPSELFSGADTVASGQRHSSRLAVAETTALGTAAAGLGASVEEVLLTALARVLSRFSRLPTLLIDLEAHGREELFDELDLSRSVGWFTALYPLRLELAPEAGFEADLAAVQARLRAVPTKGLSFGVLRYLADADTRRRLARLDGAPVLFNYLGRVTAAGEAPFQLIETGTSSTRAPENHRSHSLEVVALEAQGQIGFSWSYSRERHHPTTIRRLDAELAAELVTFARRDEADSAAPLPLGAVAPDLDSLLEEVNFGEV